MIKQKICFLTICTVQNQCRFSFRHYTFQFDVDWLIDTYIDFINWLIADFCRSDHLLHLLFSALSLNRTTSLHTRLLRYTRQPSNTRNSRQGDDYNSREWKWGGTCGSRDWEWGGAWQSRDWYYGETTSFDNFVLSVSFSWVFSGFLLWIAEK